MRFASIAANDLKEVEYWITFGAYESQVTERMLELGVRADRIINLGFTVNPTLDQIFDQIANLIQGTQGVLIGLVNIHTPQAELLMEYFHHRPDAPIHAREDQAWIFYRPEIEKVKEKMTAHLARRE
jgi:hypothetical protein